VTLDQFQKLADVWGGDIARWPPETQPSARVVAASAEGQRIIAANAWLDRNLAKPVAIDPDRAARASVAVLQRLAAPKPLPWYRRWLRPVALVPATSLACSAALGLWFGGAVPSRQPQDAATVIGLVFEASAATPWSMP
jgi:hypothetical protein